MGKETLIKLSVLPAPVHFSTHFQSSCIHWLVILQCGISMTSIAAQGGFNKPVNFVSNKECIFLNLKGLVLFSIEVWSFQVSNCRLGRLPSLGLLMADCLSGSLLHISSVRTLNISLALAQVFTGQAIPAIGFLTILIYTRVHGKANAEFLPNSFVPICFTCL